MQTCSCVARQGGQESATAADIVENVVFAVPRFTEVVRSFLYTVADSLESPLILFLDDVQWADSESLALIASLTSLHSACRNLILVLATRVNTEYQLNRSNLVSEKTGFRIEEIKLNELDLTSTNELISKTLHMSLEDTLPLSELTRQRTGGNVLFVVEFLQMLHREELLHYSMGTFRWEWNIKKIQGETNVTDYVAVLLTTKIRQLPQQVRSALQMAACLGFYFDIEILERIVSELDETFKKESVLPEKSAIWRDESSLNNAFREAIKLACDENLVDLVTDTKYKFSHDRVQHAVYQMVPAGKEKELLHWRIGQILWSELRQSTYTLQDDWMLFTAADQLNRGSIRNVEALSDEKTRLSLVRLNLDAGKKAFQKSAFKHAAEFLDRGVLLMETTRGRWMSDYSLCLEVYTQSAEAAYIVGSFDKCEMRANTILENAQRLDDKLRPYIVLVESLGAEFKKPSTRQ